MFYLANSTKVFINVSPSTVLPRLNLSNAVISKFSVLSSWYLKHSLYSMTKNSVTGMIWLTLSGHPWMYVFGIKVVYWVYAPCIVRYGPLCIVYPNLVIKLVRFISWLCPKWSCITPFGSFVLWLYTILCTMRNAFICLTLMSLLFFSTGPTSDVRLTHNIPWACVNCFFLLVVFSSCEIKCTYCSLAKLCKGSLIYEDHCLQLIRLLYP